MSEQKNNSVEPGKDGDKISALSTLISNPQVMNAFGEKLQSMVGEKSEFIANLPATIKRRLKALKKLQLESFNIEAQYHEEVHKLECKFESLYAPIFEKRKEIVTAEYEPNDAECVFEEEEEEEEDEDEGGDKEIKKPLSVFPEDTKGIPEFWLTIFKNVESIAHMISEEDEEVLKHLRDLRVEFHEDLGFELMFDFGENDFFTEKILTKKYDLCMRPDIKCPMSYEGPEITKCSGCKVTWKEGKDRTVDKDGGKKESFFKFFEPPVVDESKEDGKEKEELQQELLADYDLGHIIQSSIIPRAVLYYTGEALDDDDDDDELNCSDEDDDEEDDDEEGKDPEYKPPKGAKAECKQQ